MSEPAVAQVLAEWLPRLGLDPVGLRAADVLSGGASGSLVCRLEGHGRPLVLKLTTADAPGYARARALREAAFYRELAAGLPVLTPELLGAAEGQGGASALLLAAYAPPPPPAAWPPADSAEAARQLALLHAHFWGAPERLAAHRWLRQPEPVTPEIVGAARAAWAELERQESTRELFTQSRRRLVAGLLAAAAAPPEDPRLPPTLCHGDVHMDNLLRDDAGHLVWADWQEVGVGQGADDLSFFLQRASQAGAGAPAEALLAAYHAQLERSTGLPIDVGALRRRVAAHELATRLLHWPAYLIGAPPAALATQLERIELLAGAEGT